jgi:hypothetical protein
MERIRYRQLRLLLFAGLAVLLMGQDECAVEDPSVEKSGGGRGTAKTADVGDKLTLKGTTYEVTNVRTASAVGDSFTRERANGEFVIVSLKLTNRKDEPATIAEDNIRLIGGNGKNYSVSDDALFALEDQSFLLEEIQPDNTEKGKLVYDIPESAVSRSKLQVEDFFSESKGRIRLGL